MNNNVIIITIAITIKATTFLTIQFYGDLFIILNIHKYESYSIYLMRHTEHSFHTIIDITSEPQSNDTITFANYTQ